MNNIINIYFVIWLSEGLSDNIVIVWSLVIPVHHCQLYQDILVLTTYLINIRVTLPQHKLTSSDLVIGCQNLCPIDGDGRLATSFTTLSIQFLTI